MSLSVKSLNGDTAFLLVFNPPIAPPSSPGTFPGSFTILLDPWLIGPSIILSPKFSISEQKDSPCISHLTELDCEPDLVLISQHKPDHCHEKTLRQLPRDGESIILATPPAAKKIQSWKHFRPELVQTLPRFVPGEEDSIYRITIPPPSPRGSCGEVTLTWLPAKYDLTGVHHAIGITYRPPFTPLSYPDPMHFINLPLSPPESPTLLTAKISSPRMVVPAPYNDREKTLSVIYSPHGVSFDIIRPYATSHLVSEAALPLTALLHSLDRVENPWWLGGNISTGLPGGLEIAQNLYAKAWISAHDGDKDNRGWAVKQTRIGQHGVGEVKRTLELGNESKKLSTTDVINLAAGELYLIQAG